jgi:hypothetical protein
MPKAAHGASYGPRSKGHVGKFPLHSGSFEPSASTNARPHWPVVQRIPGVAPSLPIFDPAMAPQKKYKNTLDTVYCLMDTPCRASCCLPSEGSSFVPLYLRSRENLVSEEYRCLHKRNQP